MDIIFQDNNLLVFCVVFFALIAAWNTVWAGIKNYHEARQPRDGEKARLDAVEAHLDNDNKRLKELEDSNRLVLRAISQLIEHEVTNDHIDQLIVVRDDINTYLINR